MELVLHREVEIHAGSNIKLKGLLSVPDDAEAIIVFSGNGKTTTQVDKSMAAYFNENRLGTLVFESLTKTERTDIRKQSDVSLLAKRLISATEILQDYSSAKYLPVGYFATGAGAGPALKAASILPYVYAVVSAGGSIELKADILQRVKVPTLLTVCSLNHSIWKSNKQAMELLNCPKNFSMINGVSHLAEKKEVATKVGEMAAAWFIRHSMEIKIAYHSA